MIFTRLPAMFAALLLVAGTAQAHPKLVAATPADGATVAAPRTVVLRFSETLVKAFTGLELTMLAAPGMAAMPMKNFTAAVDGKTLTATFDKPLPAGGYRVDWHAVAGDTHRITGNTGFTVR